MRVILVEDDELLGDGVQQGLKQFGYTVDWVKDGAAAKHAILSEHFDAIILDLGLPRLSGLEVLEQVRDEGVATPVLILTARDAVNDRVRGLDSGADDYLTKPFDLEELSARLRALLRRSSGRADASLVYRHITLDPASHMVTSNDKDITLSRREFALLHKLLENAGQVLSRDQLTQSMYGWEEDVDSNTLEVHIHNLRKKIDGTFIRTIRGVGYMVEKEES